jgi:bacterioferritin-associated ferredoxin
MYVCICNAITSTDIARDPSLITSCGTNCGKCVPYIQQNLIPGTDAPIYTEEQLLELYHKSLDSETPLLRVEEKP